MKTYSLVLIFVAVFYDASANNRHESINQSIQRGQVENKISTEVDALIKDLETKQWRENEFPCVDKTLSILHNVRNFTLWAVWIWDSTQWPVGIFYGSKLQLGNYDQCLKAPWLSVRPEFRTQYCLTNIKLTKPISDQRIKNIGHYDSAEEYLQTPSRNGMEFTTITWAACLPAECQSHTVSKIVNSLFMRSHLSPLRNATIEVESCQISAEKQYSVGMCAFVVMILVLLVTAVYSTYYASRESSGKEFHAGGTCLMRTITESFDLKRNYSKLIEVREDEIVIIHLLRTSTAVLALFVHYTQLSGIVPAINALDIEADLHHFLSPFAKHIEIVLNNFIVISGLLLIKCLMDKQQSLVMFLVKRYIRLMGPVAVMIFYFTAVSLHTGSGPLWPKLSGREQQACLNNWWLIPLMLNNYVNTEDMCQIIYWYIPCDFQLAVFGALIYYTFKKNKNIGWLVLIIVSVYGTFAPGWAVYSNELTPTIFNSFEKTAHLRTSDFFMKYHIKPQYRIGRYLIGMAMGYLMSTRPPLQYKKVINEKWSALMILLGSCIILSMWIAGGNMVGGHYNALSIASFVTTSNIMYAFGLCIIFCGFEYGKVQFTSKILNIPVLMLSRLSYNLYIVHIAIMQRNAFSVRSPPSYDIFTKVTEGLGVCVLAVYASLWLWFLVEAPLSSLTNTLLDSRINLSRKTKERIQHSGVDQDGVQQNGDAKQKQL